MKTKSKNEAGKQWPPAGKQNPSGLPWLAALSRRNARKKNQQRLIHQKTCTHETKVSYALCASRKALNSALALIRRGVMHGDDGHDTAVAVENLTCRWDADDALGAESCRDDADFFRIPLGSPSNTNAIFTGASASSAQLLLATSSAKSASCAVTTGTAAGGGGLHDPHSNRSSDATSDTLLRRLAPDCCLCMLDTTAAEAAAAGFFLVKPGMNMHSAPHVKPSSATSGFVSMGSSCGAMDLPSARDALRKSAGAAAGAPT